MNSSLEKYFSRFRNNIIGINQSFVSPFGTKKIIYTDWTASGRLYQPIEERLLREFGPFVGNTHTETSITGSAMTMAYHQARKIIKQHVNANANDILITAGSGMTDVINKFQRILGLKIPENIKPFAQIPDDLRPIVFITHMEHHSNQTSWLETIADVEIIPYDSTGLVSLTEFKKLLEKYKNRSLKIASITACSNVTGIQPPYHKIASLIHSYKGVCFVDFACSAPYVDIDMHPKDKQSYLDAIFFSPHKFLGGPGTSGVLLFNKKLYHNMVPDCPGGGTVKFTNPWGEHKYLEDIELREDGGTPGFLQTIKTALAIKLKEQMGTDKILKREHELISSIFRDLKNINGLNILAKQHEDRLGVISFYIDGLHFNLGVRMLNDKFGIQTRGGCSCAGTYGHYLLHIDNVASEKIEHEIEEGCLLDRPGWIRMSIHPTLTNQEVKYVCESIKKLVANYKDWEKEYQYNPNSNEFIHNSENGEVAKMVANWFI